jgi:hypothetical protein
MVWLYLSAMGATGASTPFSLVRRFQRMRNVAMEIPVFNYQKAKMSIPDENHSVSEYGLFSDR